MDHRRHVLAGLAAALLLVRAPGLRADPGHGPEAVHIELRRVDRLGKTLHLRLVVANTGIEAAVLLALYSDQGPVTLVSGPRRIEAGTEAEVQAQLEVSGEMPPILSVIADFGALGSGPVTVFTGA